MSKRIKIIHWAPESGLPVKVMRPDGIDEGIGEAGIAKELHHVVQFERYGFVRINRLGKAGIAKEIDHDLIEPIVAYFAHR